MPVEIKICGLMTADTLDAALDAGADYVGFVFFPPSPRHLGFEAARPLGERVRGRARKVALSVDADNDWLAASIDALRPDMLQLHGRETPERVAAVRSMFRLPVMKSIPVETRSDLSPIRLYAHAADRLIFDARAPRQATRPGGLGKSFDWTLLDRHRSRYPVHALGRARCDQCGGGAAHHAGGCGRCLLRRRTFARHQGPREDPRLRACGACG